VDLTGLRIDEHARTITSKSGKKKEAPFYFAQVDWPPTHFRYTQSHTVTHSHTTQRLCNKYIVVAVVVIIVAGDVSLFVSLPNHITRGAEMLRIPAGF
jgi:hypothetical protein